jgi:hypothetical protein
VPEDPLNFASPQPGHRAARERRRPAAREARHLAGSTAGRVLIGAVIATAVGTFAGLIALWRHQRVVPLVASAASAATASARVDRIDDFRCPGPTAQRCRRLIVDVGGVPAKLTLGPVSVAPNLHAGDQIRVLKVGLAPGTEGVDKVEPYSFVGVDRHGSVMTLALALARARWRLWRCAGAGCWR